MVCWRFLELAKFLQMTDFLCRPFSWYSGDLPGLLHDCCTELIAWRSAGTRCAVGSRVLRRGVRGWKPPCQPLRFVIMDERVSPKPRSEAQSPGYIAIAI